jgi:hypothetical protein
MGYRSELGRGYCVVKCLFRVACVTEIASLHHGILRAGAIQLPRQTSALLDHEMHRS